MLVIKLAIFLFAIGLLVYCIVHASRNKQKVGGSKMSNGQATQLIESAEMSLMRGNQTQAMKLFEEALKVDPDSAEAWNNLGALKGSNNDHAGAKDCFEHAVKIRADYVKAWRGLAVSEKNLEHYERALELCDKVESLNGTAGDIRADIIRRQKEHIRPPKGNPYDKSTEYAKKYSPALLSFADILKEMMKCAHEERILPAEDIKNVPELNIQAEKVVKQVLSGIEENTIQREGSFDPVNSIMVCMAFCVYAGMGAALEWDVDWPRLSKEGIYERLTAAKGIFAMDEYVTELYTGKPYSSPQGKQLTQQIRKITAPASAGVINAFAMAGAGQQFSALKDSCLVAGIACFWFGVSFAMYKIVGR